MPPPRRASSAATRDGAQPRRPAGHGDVAGPTCGRNVRAQFGSAHRRSAPACRSARRFGLAVNGMAWLVRALQSTRSAQARREAEDAHPAPDAGRCAAHPRPAQRGERAGGLALAAAIGCPLGPMLYGAARVPRRAAPRGVRRASSTGRILRRQQGHERGRNRRGAEGLGAERGKLVVILGGDGKGQDFAPLAAPWRGTRAPWC